jgi:hypothetical protein
MDAWVGLPLAVLLTHRVLLVGPQAFGKAGVAQWWDLTKSSGPAAIYCGTGFSREGVRCHTANLMVRKLASSRLKPVPLMDRRHSVRLVEANC